MGVEPKFDLRLLAFCFELTDVMTPQKVTMHNARLCEPKAELEVNSKNQQNTTLFNFKGCASHPYLTVFQAFFTEKPSFI